MPERMRFSARAASAAGRAAAVMWDDIPDAQAAAQARLIPAAPSASPAPAPRVPDARSYRSDPAPAASATVALFVPFDPSDVL